jgi:hypothetical protein
MAFDRASRLGGKVASSILINGSKIRMEVRSFSGELKKLFICGLKDPFILKTQLKTDKNV